MPILFVINVCTASILFLKEFTFSAPIFTFLAFCSLCAVTNGNISFLTLTSAELFLLIDLILSVGLTSLSVLELFTLTTKFVFILFVYHFSVLFLPPMQVSSRQAFIPKQWLLCSGYRNSKFQRRVSGYLFIKKNRPTLDKHGASVPLKLFN